MKSNYELDKKMHYDDVSLTLPKIVNIVKVENIGFSTREDIHKGVKEFGRVSPL